MAEYINDPDAPSILEILSKELSETDSETPKEINSIEILETCSGLPQEITSDKASETDDENNNEDFFWIRIISTNNPFLTRMLISVN